MPSRLPVVVNSSAAPGSPAPRTVLVTGGCGFIGVNLARSLTAAGYEPVAYDNLSTGRLEDGKAAGFAEVIEADILDADALAAAARGVYGVVHLAAAPAWSIRSTTRAATSR